MSPVRTCLWPIVAHSGAVAKFPRRDSRVIMTRMDAPRRGTSETKVPEGFAGNAVQGAAPMRKRTELVTVLTATGFLGKRSRSQTIAVEQTPGQDMAHDNDLLGPPVTGLQIPGFPVSVNFCLDQKGRISVYLILSLHASSIRTPPLETPMAKDRLGRFPVTTSPLPAIRGR
jgi:hypothetical protein